MNYCLIGEGWLTEYFMREWYDYLPEREQLYSVREFTIYKDTKIRGDEWQYHDILVFDNYDKFDKRRALEILSWWMNRDKLVFVLTEHEIDNGIMPFFEDNQFEIINLDKELHVEPEIDISDVEFKIKLRKVLKRMKYPLITMQLVPYNKKWDKQLYCDEWEKELDEKKPRDPVKN